tara:strand:+ start:330 stop:677 length:348 start_codon:yes stop_codon:yes gene_type:complete
MSEEAPIWKKIDEHHTAINEMKLAQGITERVLHDHDARFDQMIKDSAQATVNISNKLDAVSDELKSNNATLHRMEGVNAERKNAASDKWKMITFFLSLVSIALVYTQFVKIFTAG